MRGSLKLLALLSCTFFLVPGSTYAGPGDPSLASLRLLHLGPGVTESLTCGPSGFFLVQFISGGVVFFASDTSTSCVTSPPNSGADTNADQGIDPSQQETHIRTTVEGFISRFGNGASGNDGLVGQVVGFGGEDAGKGRTKETRSNKGNDEGGINEEINESERSELLRELKRQQIKLDELTAQMHQLTLDDLQQRREIVLAALRKAGLFKDSLGAPNPNSLTKNLDTSQDGKKNTEYGQFLRANIKAYEALQAGIADQKERILQASKPENKIHQFIHPSEAPDASTLRTAIRTLSDVNSQQQRENIRKKSELNKVSRRLESSSLHQFEKSTDIFTDGFESGNSTYWTDTQSFLNGPVQLEAKPIQLASASAQEAWLMVAQALPATQPRPSTADKRAIGAVGSTTDETLDQSLEPLRTMTSVLVTRSGFSPAIEEIFSWLGTASRAFEPGAINTPLPRLGFPGGQMQAGALPGSGSAGVNLFDNIDFYTNASASAFEDKEGTRNISGDHWSAGAGVRLRLTDETGLGLSAAFSRSNNGGQNPGNAGTDSRALELALRVAHRVDTNWIVDGGVGLHWADYEHSQGGVTGDNTGFTWVLDTGVSHLVWSQGTAAISARLGHRFARTQTSSYTASDGTRTSGTRFESGEASLGLSGNVDQSWGSWTVSTDLQYDTISRGRGLDRFDATVGAGAAIALNEAFTLSAGLNTLVGRADYQSIGGSIRLGAAF